MTEPRKVWIVMWADYADSQVDSIWSTVEGAELRMEEARGPKPHFNKDKGRALARWHSWYVEDWLLDAVED